MKRLIASLFIFTTAYYTLPANSLAHLAGQPPFFKINGQYSGLYHVPISSSQFEIPQDNAPQSVLIGEKIDFEIDTQAMQIPQDIVSKSTFLWNYGDGTTGAGLQNSHVYEKQGSYILTIDVTYGEVPEPTLLQSVVINVLPDKNYQLPTVKIKVNGQEPKDPIVDVIQLKYGQPVNFQAETTASSGAKITNYIWDFNDNETANTPKVAHTYKENQQRSQFFPIVRAQDSNGFFTDAYVQLSADPNYIKQVKKTNTLSKYALFGLAVLLILGFTALFMKGSKKKK